ncbi:Similar to SGCA: Alpha-sarcoglycan (Oryctolagus cuniculus) [Cotesia congregata]|uniref:Similar to SGCA: Alpha-sarcoglycan (Oryctolagus cuniculus) n=1 Tax=Cotesia congregata TaxID=51543 RepID=A0A8J2E311_COTCN|nr:Similar to SGCA: Alpha-sarcoglycan (Oryctolagus cuniculus) [Cotesia congregata]
MIQFNSSMPNWYIVYRLSKKFQLIMTVMLIFLLIGICTAEKIVTSKVFVIPIGPKTFNWTSDGNKNTFSYQASLMNAPDLPPWIHYTYSNYHHKGFLYGVAPKDQGDFKLEIVGLNKKNYETSYKVIDINVEEKKNLTTYEVYLKIDNLNIEQTFDNYRMENLLNVFRVVLKLGSTVQFSHDLNHFEEELRPLKIRSPCPKDFKRSSRERIFRDAGFVLDWCSFKLISENHSLLQESARREPSMNVIGRSSLEIPEHVEWLWARPKKSLIPTRSYLKEILLTVFTSLSLLLVLFSLLSTAFCFHHIKLKDPVSKKYFYELFNIYQLDHNQRNRPTKKLPPVENVEKNGVQMVHYATTQKGTLRSLTGLSANPDDLLLQSSRINIERCNPYIRPNPPPYNGPNNIGTLRVNF